MEKQLKHDVNMNIAEEINTQDLKYLQQQLLELIDKINNTSNNHLNTLKGELVNLKKENFILNKLPQQITEQVEQFVPSISKEIIYQLFKDINHNINNVNTELSSLIDKTNLLTNQISSWQTGKLKKKCITFGLIAILQTIIALSSSYLVLNQFPRSYWLDAKGSVNINHSEVSIRSTSIPQINNIVPRNKDN